MICSVLASEQNFAWPKLYLYTKFSDSLRILTKSIWAPILMWVDSGQQGAALQNNLMHGPFTLLVGPLDGRLLRIVSPPSSWENQIWSFPNLLLFLWGWYWKAGKQCLFILYMQSYHLYINHILGCDFFSYFVTTDINDIPNIFCDVYLILKVCIFFLSLFLGQNSFFSLFPLIFIQTFVIAWMPFNC